MTTSEKLAYLKGILAASNITDSQTKRIYEAIVDVLESVCEDVEFNTQNIDNIDSRLSEVDEDLELVESILYEDGFDEGFEEEYDEYDDNEDDFSIEDEEFDEDYFDELDDADDFEEDELDADDEFELEEELEEEPEAAFAHDTPDAAQDEEEDFFDDEYLEDEEGEEMYEIECPACHETIYLQESVILDGGVDCPNCGEPLEFDIEFEEE